MQRRRTNSPEQGFTIVELMIATLVFSVILVTIMVGVVAFTNSYFRGVNSSTTQNTTRDAMDTVTQAIQFSGGPISYSPASGTVTTYCVGNTQFDFVLGQEETSGSHVLYATPYSASQPCAHVNFGSTSQELLGKNLRLSAFTITPPSSSGTIKLFTVHMHVVYGDDSLLYSPKGSTPVGLAKDAQCRSQAGSQFCSFSDLSSTVEKRVQ